MKIFTGNSNPTLAGEISEVLNVPLGDAKVGRFSDGEIRVEILESVRGADVYVVQSTSSPVNDNLMELLIMLDALKRASAGSISAVIPYYGYGRQDRRGSTRTAITAKLKADLIRLAGATRIITMELHAGQIQGFFDGPVDHLYCSSVLVEHVRSLGLDSTVVVSPDTGGVDRARAYAQKLGVSMAILDKRRSAPNVAEVLHVIGDVRDRDAVLVDDMVDTAGTLCHGVDALFEHGARRVIAVATHGVLSGPAIDRIMASRLESLVVSNTIPLNAEAQACPKITALSAARIFAEAIRQVANNGSVQGMFKGESSK